MIGFAQIAGGAPSSVQAMTNHLLAETIPREQADIAAYYATGTRPPTAEQLISDGVIVARFAKAVADGVMQEDAVIALAVEAKRRADLNLYRDDLNPPERVADLHARLYLAGMEDLEEARSGTEAAARSHIFASRDDPDRFDKAAEWAQERLAKAIDGYEAEEYALERKYLAAFERARHVREFGNNPLVALRRDMHPLVAKGLGVDPERPILDPAQINALISGHRADGEKIYGKHYASTRSLPVDPNTGKKRLSQPIGAYDFCPTPDKSVSVAWAFAPPSERAMIYNAHIDAARKAVAYIGREVGLARFGKDGLAEVVPGHIGWMEFTHYTSRKTQFTVKDVDVVRVQDGSIPGDPNLHTHFLIPNAVFCDDGRVGSLHTARIAGFLREATAVYHATFAQNATDSGFDVVMDPKLGVAVMKAVPKDACSLFSKRTNAGEMMARKRALERGEDWEELSSDQKERRMKAAVQNLEQRKYGDKDDMADVASWKAQAKEIGWDYPASFQAYGPQAPEMTRERRLEAAYEASLDFIERKLEQSAVITRWDLRASAGYGLVHSGSRDSIQDINAVTQMMRERGVRQYGEMTELAWGHEAGERHVSVTTALHIDQEKEFIALGKNAAADHSAALPRQLLDQTILASGLDFSDEHGKAQLAMIYRLGTGGRFALGVGAAGMGKAQPIYAKVLTPDGFREIGTIRAGDIVACPDGRLSPVVGVFPQGLKRISRIQFEDGRTAECCAEHLWKVWTTKRRRDAVGRFREGKHPDWSWSVMPLSEIKEWFASGRSRIERTAIPVVSPCAIEFPEKALPVPPYTLGALLGDGTLAERGFGITTADSYIINRVLSELPHYEAAPNGKYGWRFRLRDRSDHTAGSSRQVASVSTPDIPRTSGRRERVISSGGKTQTLSQWAKDAGLPRVAVWERMARHGWTIGEAIGSDPRPPKVRTYSPIMVALRDLGLRDSRSQNKFVPEIYKYASVEQRAAVLQGLMDTDGSVGDPNRTSASFGSTSLRLANDVQEIARSLGAIASIASRQTFFTDKNGNKKAGLPSYRVSIRHPDVSQFFSLPRKKDICRPSGQFVGRLRIVSIEEAGEAECVCISVDHPDHLYITDGYVVTHNSTALKPMIAAWKIQGREVFGASLASRTTDEMVDSGIAQKNLHAFSVMVERIKSGQTIIDRNGVLVLDEFAMLGTRQGLEILRLQARHGFQIVSVGDPKQCNSIEAGDIIALSRRTLGSEYIPHVETTVRQQSDREKEIVGLLREGKARQAIDMKLEDGTALMVPGGYNECVERVAKLYAERLKETGEAPSITVPTNDDAHQVSIRVRAERKKVGLVGADVKPIDAEDLEGRRYEMRLAPGDRVRLFKSIGQGLRNGSVVDVVAVDGSGMRIRSKPQKKDEVGKERFVPWSRLQTDSGRILLSFGDALTIHSAQSMTRDEHIYAFPSGSQAVNGLAAYSAGTRHRHKAWLVTSDMAEMREVKKHRPINDHRDVTTDDKWANVAGNFAYQPEKDLALAMLERVETLRRGTVMQFPQMLHTAHVRQAAGEAPSFAHEKLGLRHLSDAAKTVRQVAQHAPWMQAESHRQTESQRPTMRP